MSQCPPAEIKLISNFINDVLRNKIHPECRDSEVARFAEAGVRPTNLRLAIGVVCAASTANFGINDGAGRALKRRPTTAGRYKLASRRKDKLPWFRRCGGDATKVI